jgi:hypothetical protein
LNPAKATCEDCREFNLSSCDACDRPRLLCAENFIAFKAWTFCRLGGVDPFSGAMRIEAIISILLSLGGCEDDIEKIYIIDDLQKVVKIG